MDHALTGVDHEFDNDLDVAHVGAWYVDLDGIMPWLGSSPLLEHSTHGHDSPSAASSHATFPSVDVFDSTDQVSNFDFTVPPIHNASERKRKAPTLRPKDWEPFKARIVDLHLSGCTVTSISAKMEADYGFRATLASPVQL